jgi:3-oxoadipate enol-lactonase
MKATVSDGVQIAYDIRAGSSGAPRLVLLHSLAMDRHVWDDVIAEVGASVEIMTLDCRGHGASSAPPGPYALTRFAEDLGAVLDAAGWERAFVAGMSMGGCVALQFASAFPQRVTGLGLIDTTAWYGPDAAQNWNERASKAETDGLASLLAFQETRWFGDAFRAQHPPAVARARATFLNNAVPAYAATCRMLGNFDLRTALPHLHVPVEIAVGAEDYATPPEMAEVLASTIPGAHLEIIPNARHFTAIEVPATIAALLRRLIARGTAVGARAR